MSNCTHRLRTYDQAPPGGYPFVQTEGIGRNFPSIPMIEDQAKAVSAFRAGNGLPRASLKEALEDVDCYTCQRLGNMGAFCVEVSPGAPKTVALNESSPIVAPPCKGCGAKVA